MSPDYNLTVADSFKKYLETGDEKLIENYTSKELHSAISQLSPHYNTNKLWFRQIQRRIEELSYLERRNANPSDLSGLRKWLDKVIAFGLGIGLGLML